MEPTLKTLKPCPFCGFEIPTLIEKYCESLFYGRHYEYTVTCPACPCHLNLKATSAELAREVWNRRSNKE